MKKSNRVFKMIAVTVILALVINLLPNTFGTYKAWADTTGGDEVPTYEGILELVYGANDSAMAEIPFKEELRQTGDSKYEFTLTLDPVTMINDQSDKNTSSKNGYFTAQIEGYYMVDLYGGKGGSGQSLIFPGCGYGGARGHVYGAVYLKKGDTLVYSIGGNGATVTVKDATAGNGGSAHGEEGSKEIGSGGGFSAVYLFKADESLAGYTDAQGNLNFDTIKEADRLSKLIMLAGGGGGGAADSSDINIFNTPDGGAGGNIDGSYVRVDDGIIFTGSNGISSSKSTAYIGKGGTTVPGTAVSTDSDGYSSEAGKSWADGGTGGNSNFRGGGGGAGYNGGSGGIMKGKYEASDVGGGGGGASFVSNVVLTQYSDSEENTPYSSLFSTSMPYTSFLADSTTVDNKNGGTFHIAAISSNDTYSFMKDMTISFDNISDYFDITITSKNGTVSGNSVEGIDLIDNSGNGVITEIKVTFSPKAGFAGGNDVNLFSFSGEDQFKDISVKYSISEDGTEFKSGTIAVDKNSGEDYAYVGYVNVPLKGYSILANSRTFNGNEPEAISSASLFTKKVASDTYFIDTVGNVYINSKDVESSNTTAVGGDGKLYLASETPTPVISGAVRYPVQFTVTPKASASKAKVGTVQEATTYSTSVSINYIKPGDVEIDGYGTWINFKKELTEKDGLYTYSIDGKITFDNNEGTTNNQKPLSDRPKASDEDKDSWLICNNTALNSVDLEPGIYYFAIKGGDGGEGSDAGLHHGGKGGIGDSYKGYFVISNKTTIRTVIGSKGNDTMGAVSLQPEGKGGKGSSIKTTDDSVYISAGGGGGGGASVIGLGACNGADGTSGDNQSNANAGIDGSDGGANLAKYASTPAKCGKSNKSGFLTSVDVKNAESEDIIKNLEAKVPDSTTGGYVYIALVESYRFDQVDNPDKYRYTFEIDLSDYFSLDPTNDVHVYQNGTALSCTDCEPTLTDNGILKITVPFDYTFDGGKIKTDPCRKESSLDSIEFSLDIDLSPIDDFLGGYDVPVTKSITTIDNASQTVKVTLGSSDSNITYLKEDDTVDYANVAINTTALNGYLNQTDVFKTNDNQFYVKGYDPVKFDDVVKGTAAKTYFDGINTLLDNFVKITEVVEPTDWNGAPQSDMNIPFTFKVEPAASNVNVITAPSKATVVSNVEPFSSTKYAKVSVKTAVEFNLTNLFVNYTLEDATVNDPLVPGETKNVKRYVFVPDGNDFKCILSTTGNYKLPLEEDVQVKYRVYSGTGTDISSECTFNEFTGELTIPGKFFNDNSVVVVASAQKPDDLFHIVLEYQTAPGSQTYTLYSDPEDTTDKTKGYLTEADISNQNPTTTKLGEDGKPLIVIPEFYGYNFLWEDGLYDANGGKTYGGECDLSALMPANDIYIMGSYVPKTYKVVINYYDDGTTNSVYDSYSKNDYKFGQTIEVMSPTVAGKKPKVLKVSQVLDESFLKDTSKCTLTNDNVVTINVYYVPAESELTVMFVKEDGVTQMGSFETITEKITAGTGYSYDLSKGSGETGTLGQVYTLEGYKTFINPSTINYEATTEDTTISGTMDANGRTVKVVYVGNKIGLSFDWDESNDNGPAKSKFNNLAPRCVQYGGYISDTWNDTNKNYKTYQSLPSLSDVDGWHFKGWTMTGVTGYVDDDMIVNSTSDITLIADWEKTDITIHVYYRDTKYSKILGHEDVPAEAGVPKTISFSGITGYTLNYPSENYYTLNSTSGKYEFSVTANNDKYVYVEFTINSYQFQYQWEILDSDGNPITSVPADANRSLTLDANGCTAPANVYTTGNVDYNEGYSYNAPANPFYTDEEHKDQYRKSVKQGPTSGKMPANNVLIIITYTLVEDGAPPELICVTVTWDKLEFNYVSGTWDPDTHTTAGASFGWAYKTDSQTSPKITVENVKLTQTDAGIAEFTQPSIHAEFTYSKNTGFDDVSGIFTANYLDVYLGKTGYVDFSLSGKMSSSLKPGDTRKVGKVTVTITRSDKKNPET